MDFKSRFFRLNVGFCLILTFSIAAFADTIRVEQAVITSPPSERRAAMIAAGVKVSEVSHAAPVAQPSIMLG